MAEQKKRGCLSRALTAFLIFFLIVAVLLGGSILVVANLSIDKIGIADAEIYNGFSFRELELENLKVKNVFSYISGLNNVKEKNVVKHPYDFETEKPKADELLSKADTTEFTVEEQFDYIKLFNDGLIYDIEYLAKVDDTTIAYIINNAILQDETNAESTDLGIKFLKQYAHGEKVVKEFSIIKNEDGSGILRTVFHLNVEKLLKPINDLKVSKIFSVPQSVYIESVIGFTVDENGKMITESKYMTINGVTEGTDKKISDAIIKVLSTDADEDAEGSNDLNAQLAKSFARLLSNIGKIGTAEIDENNIVINSSSIVYGNEGFDTGYLKILVNSESAI